MKTHDVMSFFFVWRDKWTVTTTATSRVNKWCGTRERERKAAQKTIDTHTKWNLFHLSHWIYRMIFSPFFDRVEIFCLRFYFVSYFFFCPVFLLNFYFILFYFKEHKYILWRCTRVFEHHMQIPVAQHETHLFFAFVVST